MPPVLDMKWENRDINVVERANVQLDDIVTSLRLVEILYDDVLVNMIVATPSCAVIKRKQALVF